MAKAEKDQRIAQLRNLQKSKGWEVIVTDLLKNLEKLETNILALVEPGHNEIKFTQWDIEKYRRAFLNMLINYPEQLIEEYTPIEDPEEQAEKDLIEKAVIQDIG